MARINPKPYDFTKYSVLDVKEYLEKQGLQTSFESRSNLEKLVVRDYGIIIDVPVIEVSGRVSACIRFDEAKERVTFYEEGRKIFSKIKKLFGFKSDEEWAKHENSSELIKDVDKLVVKDFRKKE